MFQVIIVSQYGIFKKEKTGLINVSNNLNKRIKVIEGMTEEECKIKAEKFLLDSEFVTLKGDQK